jgi:nucleotide-binding universal stress UspA family protein
MKILIANDGSSFGEAATRAAMERPWPLKSELRVVTVLERPAVYGSIMLFSKLAEAGREAVEKIAQESAKNLARTELAVSYAVRDGEPADEIIAEAKDWQADLIIIGTHGRRGLSRFLLGSVAERVAVYAPCSVEIARDPKLMPK